MKTFTLLLLASTFASSLSHAAACARWTPQRSMGELDPKINESSGIEPSSISDELYHINDSGDRPIIYITDLSGQNLRTVEIKELHASDTEDISVASCPNGKSSCLYVADMGDNARARPYVQIAILKEKDLQDTDKAFPMNILNLTYPEGPQDAESMAVHPNGDLYILTKSFGLSRIYKVPKKQLMWTEAQAELVGTLDLKKLGPAFYLALATGMDISPDGTSFLLLTYNDVIEYPVDLSRLNDKGRVLGTQGKPLGMRRLRQQEAIAYMGEGRFIYSTEGKSPILNVSCSIP